MNYKTNKEIFGECPFWTGVEICGQYECIRYRAICHGCDYNSKHWYRRLWFKINSNFELWWVNVIGYHKEKLKNYLFNKKIYEMYYIPYWWDRRTKRKRK